uniref:Protein farnesyltransferase/geranylgeranyltransferase type-1 subunit alpha n=1 Tax=Aureoumbra lagunensis TaxID=44058 RepID=A0A7S3NMT1_9STRA|mmetsp:Transcript_3323/g.4612  ORF Transcript_3323/g.4612 Transcript_3323/m.4612 type:complete len:382 (-) Transcript_3323:182-1327(-)
MSSIEKFGDVEGISQNDSGDAVCAINYPPQYTELMDIFRAVMVSGEKSERVLELTADIIEWNAAHYTVWVVRRDVLHHLASCENQKELYNVEMEYAESVAISNPKNYQIWYHRREILLKLDTEEDARLELQFIARMLEDDSKNYHAWSHRLWVLRQFKTWENELDFTRHLLEEDAWNNSAWNHRHSVFMRDSHIIDDVSFVLEIQFVMSCIRKAGLQNESPYTYALSIAKSNSAARDCLDTAISEIIQNSNLQPQDRCCARIIKLELLVLLDSAKANDQAATHATILASSEDSFRIRYWTRRAWSLQNRARQLRGEELIPFSTIPAPSTIPWAPESWFPFGYPPNIAFDPSQGGLPEYNLDSSASVPTTIYPPSPPPSSSS